MASVGITSFSQGDLNRISAQLGDEACAEAHLCRLLKDCISAEGHTHDAVAARALRECRTTLQAALLHVLSHNGWDLHLLRAPVWNAKQSCRSTWPAQEK